MVMTSPPPDQSPDAPPLRRGWTTGACAAAAAAAALEALIAGTFPDPVTIALPRGERPSFGLSRHESDGATARAGVRKDAGDDPDVTHGLEVVATVRRLSPGAGIRFAAGEGVGTVTRPGLPISVGEPAINPGPRRIIAACLHQVAEHHATHPDAAITIAIPGGAEAAGQTLNPRLGIVGGLSVLGTTGVVVPYSASSWIATIHRGIDVARALGLGHIGAATGSTSEAAVAGLHGLADAALVEMGGFARHLLAYLRARPVARLTIGAGLAKGSKLAAGHLDLHSASTPLDAAALRRRLADEGLAAPDDLGTAHGLWQWAVGTDAGAAARFAQRLAADAAAEAGRAAPATSVDVVLVDRAGEVIGHG